MNNSAVPDPRTYAQGSNRPFGLSPLILTRRQHAPRGMASQMRLHIGTQGIPIVGILKENDRTRPRERRKGPV